MTPEKIRELAEAMCAHAAQLGHLSEDKVDGEACYWTNAMQAVWPKVFAPPAGSVKVRIVVSVDVSGDATAMALFDHDNIADEIRENELYLDGRATHRGIVEAFLPLIAPVPVVSGQVKEVGDA